VPGKAWLVLAAALQPLIQIDLMFQVKTFSYSLLSILSDPLWVAQTLKSAWEGDGVLQSNAAFFGQILPPTRARVAGRSRGPFEEGLVRRLP
jgi:hypothetical protein